MPELVAPGAEGQKIIQPVIASHAERYAVMYFKPAILGRAVLAGVAVAPECCLADLAPLCPTSCPPALLATETVLCVLGSEHVIASAVAALDLLGCRGCLHFVSSPLFCTDYSVFLYRNQEQKGDCKKLLYIHRLTVCTELAIIGA